MRNEHKDENGNYVATCVRCDCEVEITAEHREHGNGPWCACCSAVFCQACWEAAGSQCPLCRPAAEGDVLDPTTITDEGAMHRLWRAGNDAGRGRTPEDDSYDADVNSLAGELGQLVRRSGGAAEIAVYRDGDGTVYGVGVNDDVDNGPVCWIVTLGEVRSCRAHG